MADRLWMPFRGEKTAPFLESDKPYSESIKRYFSWVERLCEICSVNVNEKHVYILDYLDDERAQVWECIWNMFPEPTEVDGQAHWLYSTYTYESPECENVPYNSS